MPLVQFSRSKPPRGAPARLRSRRRRVPAIGVAGDRAAAARLPVWAMFDQTLVARVKGRAPAALGALCGALCPAAPQRHS
jgi:hypothetical protein